MGGPGRVSMSRIAASGKQGAVGLREYATGSVVKLEIRDLFGFRGRTIGANDYPNKSPQSEVKAPLLR